MFILSTIILVKFLYCRWGYHIFKSYLPLNLCFSCCLKIKKIGRVFLRIGSTVQCPVFQPMVYAIVYGIPHCVGLIKVALYLVLFCSFGCFFLRNFRYCFMIFLYLFSCCIFIFLVTAVVRVVYCLRVCIQDILIITNISSRIIMKVDCYLPLSYPLLYLLYKRYYYC